MKSILPYIVLMTATLVGAVAIIAAVYYLKPQLLGAAPKAARISTAKDSAGTKTPGAPLAQGQNPDSASPGGNPSAAVQRDTAAGLADSIRTLNLRIEEQQKAIAELTAKAAPPPRPDSASTPGPSAVDRAKDSKSFAKMLETMPAEQAVRILKGLDDREVKAVLLGVKKRQASKILSALDPERAARMMRTMQ